MQIRRLLLRPLQFGPIQRWLRPALRDAMPIFMFHRFAQPDLGIRGHSPDVLRRQLAALRRNGVRLVSLAELAGRDGQQAPRGPEVAFTVDDGYSNFKDVALPVFQEFDCPVSVFVSTGVIDGTCWYWSDQLDYLFLETARTEVSVPLGERPVTYRFNGVADRWRHAANLTDRLKSVPEDVRLSLIAHIATTLEVEIPAVPPTWCSMMTWEEIAACESTGVVSFGPHTITHPSLPQTTIEQAREEIIGSWERLQQKTSAPLPIFCYPFGAYSEREVEILDTTTMSGAITTAPRYSALQPFSRVRGPERFTVPRFAYPDNAEQFLQIVVGFERLKLWVRQGRRGWSTAVRAAPPRGVTPEALPPARRARGATAANGSES